MMQEDDPTATATLHYGDKYKSRTINNTRKKLQEEELET